VVAEQPIPSDIQSQLVSEVLDAQHLLMQALHRRLQPPWTGLDLTFGQLKALFMLLNEGPMPIGQLGSNLGLSKPAATLLVDTLVRQGLADRAEDPADRRRTLTDLTPYARGLLTEEMAVREAALTSLLRQLTPEDLAALANGMRALSAAAVRAELQTGA
jgi:DNA-binding MarR family transcriptional regulator